MRFEYGFFVLYLFIDFLINIFIDQFIYHHEIKWGINAFIAITTGILFSIRKK